MNKLKLNKYTKGFLLVALILLFMGIKPLSAYQEIEKIRVYRVQFAASKTFIEPSYFQKKFELENEINYFEKDGWFKYYVGEFDTEAEAIAYYHQTNDVGYVISSIIEKPLEIEEDTLQVVIADDSLNQEDPGQEIADTLAVDSLPIKQAEQEITRTAPVEHQESNGGLTLGQVLLICLIAFLLIILIVFVFRYLNRKGQIPRDKDERKEDIKEDDKDELDQLLSGKEPFAFLDQADRNLSSWEQLRLLEKLKKFKKALPEFSFWLDSENSSIVVFCLRMIRSFGQTEAYNQVIRLLDHSNNEVRAEAIVTLGDIGNKRALDQLKDHFEQENYTNRMLILRTMARMPDDSSIEFLKDLLENQVDFRIEAAHALASIKSIGIEGVEAALKDMGSGAENIARHILINKL